MITLKDWMSAVNYRITSGGEYGWTCFGPNAHVIDADHPHNGNSSSIVLDRVTDEVYQVTVFDSTRNVEYRITNHQYWPAFKVLEDNCGQDSMFKTVDVESDVDILEKVTAIINGQPYDERVIIQLNLPDDVLFTIMKMAHERDITFNEMVASIALEHAKGVLETH